MRFTKKQLDHAVYERTLALQAKLGDKNLEADRLWKERPELKSKNFWRGFWAGGFAMAAGAILVRLTIWAIG